MDTDVCVEGSANLATTPNKRYVFLTADLETDSLDVDAAEILEIAATLTRQPLYPLSCEPSFTALVHHGHVPLEVTTLTGITALMVATAKPFEQVCSEFVEWLQRCKDSTHADNVVLIFHNGHKFDVPILQKLLKRCGARLPEWVLCGDSYEMVESICHQTFAYGKRSLRALSLAMNIVHPPHRALGDAECLAKILQAIPRFTTFRKETLDEWFIYTARTICKW
jgi:DNA polymerase III epsilon subunit-like protein